MSHMLKLWYMIRHRPKAAIKCVAPRLRCEDRRTRLLIHAVKALRFYFILLT